MGKYQLEQQSIRIAQALVSFASPPNPNFPGVALTVQPLLLTPSRRAGVNSSGPVSAQDTVHDRRSGAASLCKPLVGYSGSGFSRTPEHRSVL